MTLVIDPSELLTINYILVDNAVLWDANPKEHDLHTLVDSITKNGFQDPGKFELSLNQGKGGIIFGNGRTFAIKYMQDHKFTRPKGIGYDEQNPDKWYVPVLFGNDIANETQAIAFALDHNLVGFLGVNGVSHLDATRVYDLEIYMALAAQTIEYSTTTTMDDLALLEQLAKLDEEPLDLGSDQEESNEKDNIPKVLLKFVDEDNRQSFLEFLNTLEAVEPYEQLGDTLLRFINNTI